MRKYDYEDAAVAKKEKASKWKTSEEREFMKKIYSILCLTAFLTGCLSSTANEGLKRVQQNGEPIFISEMSLQSSNISPIRIFWFNLGPRTFQKVNFAISIFDEDGKKIHETELEHSGPHVPMDEKTDESPMNRTWWLGDWYDDTMVCLTLDKIEITFDDETTTTIEEKEHLKRVIAEDTLQNCQKS